MYHSFFHLSAEPFGVTPDPRFLFASAQHTEAAASICYAIMQRRGFAALIAPPGLGKTTVTVNVMERLRANAEFVFLVHPKLDGDTLLESVLTGLGVDPDVDRAKRTQQLANHLRTVDEQGRSCVVILDEAQNLSAEALETIRMLSNFEVPGRKVIQFVFVGQPALATLLKRPECEQICQRINVVARLEPLQGDQIEAYIRHRFQIVGGAEQNPFTPAALKAIAHASGGVPRIINTLCFAALTIAFACSMRQVNANMVAEAVADLSLDSAAPVATTSKAPAKVSATAAPAFTTVQESSRRSAPALVALLLLAVVGIAFWSTTALGGHNTQLGKPSPAQQSIAERSAL